MWPFNFSLALIVGIYFFWRYSNTRSRITLLWALGFFGVGFFLLVAYLIRYNFLLLPLDDTRFVDLGMLSITMSLALNSFFLKIFDKKAEVLGRIVVSVLGIICIIFLVVGSIIQIEIFDIGSWIIRILAIWNCIFFAYFSIHSNNYRILAITVGIIFATASGILMVQFYGEFLGLIGNFLQFGFYTCIVYGVFFTRQKTGY